MNSDIWSVSSVFWTPGWVFFKGLGRHTRVQWYNMWMIGSFFFLTRFLMLCVQKTKLKLNLFYRKKKKKIKLCTSRHNLIFIHPKRQLLLWRFCDLPWRQSGGLVGGLVLFCLQDLDLSVTCNLRHNVEKKRKNTLKPAWEIFGRPVPSIIWILIMSFQHNQLFADFKSKLLLQHSDAKPQPPTPNKKKSSFFTKSLLKRQPEFQETYYAAPSCLLEFVVCSGSAPQSKTSSTKRWIIQHSVQGGNSLFKLLMPHTRRTQSTAAS